MLHRILFLIGAFLAAGAAQAQWANRVQDTPATGGQFIAGFSAASGSFIKQTMSGDGALSGDGVFTLSPVNGAPGTYGAGAQIPQFTVNGKGLVTAASNGPAVRPQYATNAAVKAASITGLPIGYAIDRQGFYAAGDGGEMTYYFSTSACTTPDNGAQIAPNVGVGCWFAQQRGEYDWRVWGVKADGVTDDTVAVNAAFAANPGRTILAYGGFAHVTDVVTLPANQHTTLQAAGALSSGFTVDGTFNLHALGILRTPFGQADVIKDIGFVFAQPDPTVATFTGSIAPNVYPDLAGVLTVTAVASGTIAVGDLVQSQTNPGTVVGGGTIITSQLSGTPGGIGTYAVNIGATVTSQSLATYRRSLLTQYPPAIYGVNSSRVTIDHVRVSGAWSCFDLTGNTGGSYLDHIQCGSLAPYQKISFQGYASGTQLHVTAVDSDSAAILTYHSFYESDGVVPIDGLQITTQASGTPGGVGVYNLSFSATIGSAGSPVKFRQATGGIAKDQAFDFDHIGALECWPFSIIGNNPLYSVYIDQTTNCVNFGRIDGITIDDLQTIYTSIITTDNSTNSIPFEFKNLQLDVGSWALALAGTNIFSGGYSSEPFSSLHHTIEARNPGTLIATKNFYSQVDNTRRCAFAATNGGELRMSHGSFITHETGSPYMCAVGGGGNYPVIEAKDNIFVVQPIARTGAILDATGLGIIRATGNTFGSNGGMSGNAISIATDSPADYISGNNFGGWGHNLNFSTSLGYYNLDEVDALTLTPSFSTNGDFSPTIVSNNSWLKRSGDFVDAFVDFKFSSNAYTTAAGILQIAATGTNLPQWITAQNGFGTCFPTMFENYHIVGLSPSPVVLSGATNHLVFYQSVSDGAAGVFDTSASPPSRADMHVVAECRYRVR